MTAPHHLCKYPICLRLSSLGSKGVVNGEWTLMFTLMTYLLWVCGFILASEQQVLKLHPLFNPSCFTMCLYLLPWFQPPTNLSCRTSALPIWLHLAPSWLISFTVRMLLLQKSIWNHSNLSGQNSYFSWKLFSAWGTQIVLKLKLFLGLSWSS